MSLAKPCPSDCDLALGMFENDRCVRATDFPPEQTVHASLVALMVGPIRQLSRIGAVAECERALLGQEAQEDPHRRISLRQGRTLQGRVH